MEGRIMSIPNNGTSLLGQIIYSSLTSIIQTPYAIGSSALMADNQQGVFSVQVCGLPELATGLSKMYGLFNHIDTTLKSDMNVMLQQIQKLHHSVIWFKYCMMALTIGTCITVLVMGIIVCCGACIFRAHRSAVRKLEKRIISSYGPQKKSRRKRAVSWRRRSKQKAETFPAVTENGTTTFGPTTIPLSSQKGGRPKGRRYETDNATAAVRYPGTEATTSGLATSLSSGEADFQDGATDDQPTSRHSHESKSDPVSLPRYEIRVYDNFDSKGGGQRTREISLCRSDSSRGGGRLKQTSFNR